MTASDRNFRILGREEPQVIDALVRLTAPDLIAHGAALTPVDVLDSKIDFGFGPREADWLSRAGPDHLFHVEGQGYGDNGFVSRLLVYHLGLSLRFLDRHVHTVAIWLRVPRPHERASVIQHHDITVNVRTVVIPETPAELLLSDPLTVCFAPGADPGAMSVDELCERVAKALSENKASKWQKAMAFVTARMVGRYNKMQQAAAKVSMDPIIEDLYYMMHDMGLEEGVKKGVKKGIKKGVKKGIERGRDEGHLAEVRDALRRVLARRKLPLSPEHEARIKACDHLPTLKRWLDQAVDADSAAKALSG